MAAIVPARVPPDLPEKRFDVGGSRAVADFEQ